MGVKRRNFSKALEEVGGHGRHEGSRRGNKKRGREKFLRTENFFQLRPIFSMVYL